MDEDITERLAREARESGVDVETLVARLSDEEKEEIIRPVIAEALSEEAAKEHLG